MKVEVANECLSVQYDVILGIGLSYGLTSGLKVSDLVKREHKDTGVKLFSIASKLAHAGNGENKFLRQLPVTLDITAPMYWWKEFDTYKVGTTAQSESTMHTLLRKTITQDSFEKFISEDTIAHLEDLRVNKKFSELINELPMGWLQRRIVTCNYAVLQNMYNQRKNHKLPEWHIFCSAVLKGVDHPEWIDKDYKPETEAE